MNLWHARKMLTGPVSYLTIETALGTGSDRKMVGSELLLAEVSLSGDEIAATLVEDENNSVKSAIVAMNAYIEDMKRLDHSARIFLTCPLFETFGFFPHNTDPSCVSVTMLNLTEMMIKHVNEFDDLRMPDRMCCLHSLVFTI